jgi:hypothetical protein
LRCFSRFLRSALGLARNACPLYFHCAGIHFSPFDSLYQREVDAITHCSVDSAPQLNHVFSAELIPFRVRSFGLLSDQRRMKGQPLCAALLLENKLLASPCRNPCAKGVPLKGALCALHSRWRPSSASRATLRVANISRGNFPESESLGKSEISSSLPVRGLPPALPDNLFPTGSPLQRNHGILNPR